MLSSHGKETTLPVIGGENHPRTLLKREEGISSKKEWRQGEQPADQQGSVYWRKTLSITAWTSSDQYDDAVRTRFQIIDCSHHPQQTLLLLLPLFFKTMPVAQNSMKKKACEPLGFMFQKLDDERWYPNTITTTSTSSNNNNNT